MTLDVLNADSLIQSVMESEATVGNDQPEQPLVNELTLGSCRDNDAAFDINHYNHLWGIPLRLALVQAPLIRMMTYK